MENNMTLEQIRLIALLAKKIDQVEDLKLRLELIKIIEQIVEII